MYVPTGADYVSNRDFADFPISPEVLKAIHEIGYRTATPVQAATIEPALAGKDLLVRAKTGTGKTAAFCIPIVERLADGERTARAVILAPTRELAQQTADECTALVRYRDLSVALLVGGMPMGPQERALEQGAAIIVGTPGRILDHLRRRNLNLSSAQMCCLDEADEMLSMGFYEDVTAILDAAPQAAQIMLFSATISPQTERLIAKYMKEPEQIRLSTDMDQVEGIEHVIYETPPGQHKVRSLLYLLDLEDPSSAIIFCNTREDAATVASFLDRQGLDVQLISGELPQTRRNKVMKQVKNGAVRFLVATDVAARGIDISDLSHVIQYSLPQDPSIYLHRTGRTGRIGKKGKAISLVGGPELQTKRVLESQHNIKFVEKAFPDPDECTRRRVERQAAQIRDAMGTMVFEAYVPTARALVQRPDGEALIAAALRAFFQWDRTRRAEMAEAEGEAEEPTQAADQAERAPRRGRERERERDRDRDRGGRKERDRDKGRGERREARRPRREEAQALPTDDLDALLVSDDLLLEEGEPASVAPEEALEAESGEPGDRKKKRRRRRKGKGKGEAATAGEAGEDSIDLDESLLLEDEPARESAEASQSMDDLDSLLSVD